MNSFKREINFDFSMVLLDKHFGGTRSQAYKKIGKYLKEHNFTHPLYSGYLSKEKLTDKEVLNILFNLFEIHPWIEKSLKACHMTIANANIDVLAVKKNMDLLLSEKTLDLFENNISLNEKEEKHSLDEQIREMKIYREFHAKRIERIDKEINKLLKNKKIEKQDEEIEK